MKITKVETVTLLTVEFDAREAGEMRAIGHLPPRFIPAPAELRMTIEELIETAELPLPAPMRDAITTLAAQHIASKGNA